jgi:hypothetical protein
MVNYKSIGLPPTKLKIIPVSSKPTVRIITKVSPYMPMQLVTQ